MKRLLFILALTIGITACDNNKPGHEAADPGLDPNSVNSTVDTTVMPAPPGTDTALQSNRMMAPEGVHGMAGAPDSTHPGSDTPGRK